MSAISATGVLAILWNGSTPSMTFTLWLVPLAVAFLACALLTPATIHLANRLGIIDQPVGIKIHKVPTPLLGGVAVYLAVAIATLIYLPVQGPVRGLLCGGAVAVGIGILDDHFKLRPLVHLAGQILAAVVAIVTGLGYVNNISNPIASAHQQHRGNGSWTFHDSAVWLTTHVKGSGIPFPVLSVGTLAALIGIAFTLLWIVIMMNTVNFVDGLDGLSSGVGIIVAITLGIWALNKNNDFSGGSLHQLDHAPAVLAFILAGALIGFLVFNWNPARVFIGDSGVMFVGLALGVLSIFGIAKIGTALIILSIPVLDVAWAILRRTLHGKSFLAGDKQHVYHRMVELGMSPKWVVIVLYSICAALAGIDLQIAHKPRLIAFGVIAAIAGLGFVVLEIAGNRKKASSPSGRAPRLKPDATSAIRPEA